LIENFKTIYSKYQKKYSIFQKKIYLKYQTNLFKISKNFIQNFKKMYPKFQEKKSEISKEDKNIQKILVTILKKKIKKMYFQKLSYHRDPPDCGKVGHQINHVINHHFGHMTRRDHSMAYFYQ